MIQLAFAGPFLAALILAAAICRLLVHPRFGPQILDRPGTRSLHTRPTPRTGGFAIFGAVGVAMVLAWLTCLPLWLPAHVLGALGMVMAISLVDDLRGLPAVLRLPVHATAAVIAVFGGGGLDRIDFPGGVEIQLGWYGIVLTLLFIVWMTNLFNFMDGVDGFAGGMAAWGFSTLGLIGWLAGHQGYALTAGLLAAASIGFLTANFPPARIFMGDLGSVSLGFMAALLGLEGVHAGLFSLWVFVLAFSPFIVDATATLLRRAFRGERVWQAHRSHYYQRLVLAGWSHRRTTLAGYGVMALASSSAIWVALWPAVANELAVTMIACAGYVSIAVFVTRLERRRDQLF